MENKEVVCFLPKGILLSFAISYVFFQNVSFFSFFSEANPVRPKVQLGRRPKNLGKNQLGETKSIFEAGERELLGAKSFFFPR